MNAERLEIARRLVACPKWVWLPGMQDDRGTRITGFSEADEMAEIESRPMSGEWPLDMKGRVPDLDDELTRMGVLAVVRRAWGPMAYIETPNGVDRYHRPVDRPSWRVYFRGGVSVGQTEEEALIAALESAS